MNFRLIRIFAATLFAAALLFALPTAAFAQNSWTETIDAGSTIATAQTTAGPGTMIKILGSLASSTDVDIYCVNVINPPAFSAQVVCTSQADPNIYLFRANGTGDLMNDVCAGNGKLIPAGTVTTVGQYFIAIAPQGYMPQSGAGAIWQTALFTGPRAPDGAGAAGALTGWSGSGTPTTNQAYLIQLTGAGFCASAVSSRDATWGRLKLHHR
jgi:hypothetical protein